jgi:hypothetical protein
VGVAVKPVGKPDVRNGPVRFDERGRETTDGLLGPGQAPFLDSTAKVTTLECREALETRKFLFPKQRADLGIFSLEGV